MAVLRLCGGVATSATLQTQLGLSQPAVSRALMQLIQSGEVPIMRVVPGTLLWDYGTVGANSPVASDFTANC